MADVMIRVGVVRLSSAMDRINHVLEVEVRQRASFYIAFLIAIFCSDVEFNGDSHDAANPECMKDFNHV